MEKHKIYIDNTINLSVNSSCRNLQECNVALLHLSGQTNKDIARIRQMVSSPSTYHIALFAYSDAPVTNEDRLSLLSAGYLNIFIFPEVDDWIIASLENAPIVNIGIPFPRFDKNITYRLWVYDDSSAVVGAVSTIAKRASIVANGSHAYEHYERQAPIVNADLYLIDMININENIGVQLIEDIRNVVSGAIVAHSNIHDPFVKIDCLKAGAIGFIPKTRNTDFFLKMLMQYSSIGRYLKETAEK